jgi:hypothetical protein
MLEILFWVAVGAVVGWNFPQPFWAVAIQAKFKEIFAKMFTKKL